MGPTVVLCTVWGIILTFALEFATHARFGSTSTDPPKAISESRGGDEAVISLLPISSTPPPAENDVPQKSIWRPKEIPTPRTRASRFALGLVIYAGIVTLFSLRMGAAVEESHIPSVCRGRPGLGPDWAAITFLNIIPFVSATMAFARCLVDCVLVRYGTFLGNGRSERGALVWRPFVLFVGVFMVLRFIPALMMGREEVSKFTRGSGEGARGAEWGVDEEMRGEEERGLIEHVDGGEGGDGEEPPAYEEALGGKVAH